MASKNITYEKAIEELNDIIAQIEESNLPLDKMITLYEKGNELIKYCEKELKKFEEKINVINRNNSGE